MQRSRTAKGYLGQQGGNKTEVVDGGAFLKDSQFAKTIMQWNDVYMNVEAKVIWFMKSI